MNTPLAIITAALVLAVAACSSRSNSHAKLPFGALDTPADGSTISGTTFAFGWALSEDGVDHVEIYLDRAFLQNATLKGKRDDVIKVYPAFAKVQDVRFLTELHTESMPVGIHELSARVVSRKQQTRDLNAHRINITH